jgi:hypothetical protein
MINSPASDAFALQARPSRNRINDAMTSANSFVGARIELAGHVRGADEIGHRVFKVTRTEGPELYGDYFEVFEKANPNDYNIEIREFGYVVANDLGARLDVRQRFSVEESTTVEQLIRALFSTPDIFKGRYLPPARFLGGVGFRPNWISQTPSVVGVESASARQHAPPHFAGAIIERVISAIRWRPGSGS